MVLERYRHSIFSVVSPKSLAHAPTSQLVKRINRRAPYVGEVQVADAQVVSSLEQERSTIHGLRRRYPDIGYRGTFGLRPVTRTRAGAVPRRLHADALAISGWITSVIDRQPCLAGRPELENAAGRRGSQPSDPVSLPSSALHVTPRVALRRQARS